ncbi:MAG: hypothetical protein HZB91_02870 [Elusimicrobia bacterium]|nr:hypothetical protein [Elusimicrobiota bacterium]
MDDARRGPRERLAAAWEGLTSLPAWGLWLWLALALVTAFSIKGFHHPDEKGQISAFLALKLGVQPEHHMPWDYELRLRPWFQPAFYYALVAPVTALAGYRYWAVERALLLVQVLLLACVALWSWRMWLAQDDPAALAAELPGRRPARGRTAPAARGSPEPGTPELLSWGRILVGTMWFLPALLVRHSSEAFSTIWLLAALGAWHRLETSTSGKAAAPRNIALLAALSGAAAGLAFWSRFQTAFFVAGFWLTRIVLGLRKGPAERSYSLPQVPAAITLQGRQVPGGGRLLLACLAWFAAGVLATLPLGLAIDAWGYGVPALSPWNYFAANILHDRASLFGVQPWHWYATGAISYTLNPLLWVWLVLAAVWLRRSPWYASLTGGLALFLAAHFAVPHKEMRFLAPAFVVFLLLLLGLFEAASRFPAREAWKLRLAGLCPPYLKAVALLNIAGLAGMTLFGLVQDSARAEAALWELPPGSRVLSRSFLYAGFGAPYAEMRRGEDNAQLTCPDAVTAIDRSLRREGPCPLRDAFTFAMPPGLDFRYTPAPLLLGECAKDPAALVLLSSWDHAFKDLVLQPWPAVAAFPPSWSRTDAWPASLKKGIPSFKLVRCSDFLAAGGGGTFGQ